MINRRESGFCCEYCPLFIFFCMCVCVDCFLILCFFSFLFSRENMSAFSLVGFLCVCVAVFEGARFGPGVVVEDFGELWVVDQYVYVSIELDCLNGASEMVPRLKQRLNEMKAQVGELRERSVANSKLKKVVNLVDLKMKAVDDKIRRLTDWFPNLFSEKSLVTLEPKGGRVKRAVGVIAVAGVAGVGIAAVAGVAIASLVKVHNLEKVVSSQGKSILILKENMKKVELSLNTAIDHLNLVQDKLETLSFDFDMAVTLMYLQTVLDLFDGDVQGLIDCVHTQADFVIRGAKGEMPIKALPFGAFWEAIHKAMFEHHVHPLFPEERTFDYYTVLEISLSDAGLLVKIPLSSTFKFSAYKLYPFPSFHEATGKVLTFKGSELVFLQSTRFYSCVEAVKVDDCPRVRNVSVCLHNEVTMIHRKPPYECCYELLRNDSVLDKCEFVENPPSAAVLLLQENVAAYMDKRSRVEVKCPGQALVERSIRGTAFFRSTCQVETPYFFFPGYKAFKELMPVFESERVHMDNFSLITIPEGMQFDRIKKLVLVEDKGEPLFTGFDDDIQNIILIVLAGLLGLMALWKCALELVRRRLRRKRCVRNSVETSSDCTAENKTVHAANKLEIVHTSK